MLIKGKFYNSLAKDKQYSAELRNKIEETVQQFLDVETNMNRPGILLGKIQSGKTRAFIGIMALAFDNNYDMVIILTKGTKALAKQTFERLKKDFHEFIEDDKIKLYDILHIPDHIPGFILKQKLVMIVKKETNNLERIIRMIVETYPDLSTRKVLIIDDEADIASIGFIKNKKEGIIEQRKIASQIDQLRKKVDKSDFLQVTATPYSLYLQPDDLTVPNNKEPFVFEPIRPAFTILLPIYDGYVGGDFFFTESKTEGSIAYYVYEEVTPEELDALKRQNGHIFKIEESLTHKRIKILRRGICNFIVGACIRRIQQRKQNIKEQKYSFVVHTEQGREAHDWQIEVVTELKDLLIYNAKHNVQVLSELVRESYDDLCKSVKILGVPPAFNEVFNEVTTALKDDYLMITKVNSDSEVEQLLDDNGELELNAPLNIFVGGQILDRGITIRNFIGFYYGRRPNRFQQDTVLQHSRIFGNRPKEDLVVTRFYTTLAIYLIMEKINEFDNALRAAFQNGVQPGVVFICKDPANIIIPCSPNKISISATTTLRPYTRMLPKGFQTEHKTKMLDKLVELDEIIDEAMKTNKKEEPFLLDLSTATSIVDKINETLIFEPNYEWDVEAFKACLEFLSMNTPNKKMKNKIWCLVRKDRQIKRIKDDGSFADAPDTGKTDADLARSVAIDIPALMLFRQNGAVDDQWRGSPFWWPVLVAPQKTRTMVFANELPNVD